MVKISILYPNVPGGRFDFEYYTRQHMPRWMDLLGGHAGFPSVTVERGMEGAQPGASPGYVAACFYMFDSVDDFLAAFMPHAAELHGDIPNYTDIPAEIQINEILIARSGGVDA